MDIVFMLLLLASLILLVIARINPKKAMFWKKNGEVSKKQATTVYTWAFLISFVLFMVTLPDNSKEEKAKADENKAASDYALASSCDTNFRFINNPDKYLHRKGYFVNFTEIPTEGKEWFKKSWMASTYKQNTPSAFESDKTHRLSVFQPVEVLSSSFGRAGDFDNYFLVVSPVGSTEKYIITDNEFTLKDVNNCSLLQKAKNGFYALAQYTAPADENNKPIDDRDNSRIDVPAGAHILVKSYSDIRNTIIGTIYDADGSFLVPHAHFKPGTLSEVK